MYTRLNFVPKHFHRIEISCDTNLRKIHTWISIHLNNRYAISPKVTFSLYNQVYVVGFEDRNELTYFLLACPYINRR
jgi:hypothetical protein